MLIDNAAAIVVGAIVGMAVQGVSDVLHQEVSGWESYVGAAAGGGVLGFALLQMPAASVASKAIYGGVSAGVSNYVRQFCETRISKKSSKFNVEDFAVSVSAGAVLSVVVPAIPVKGINTGRGSYLSIYRSVSKKYANGSISSVKISTSIKSSIGVQKDFGVESGVFQPQLPDGMKPAQETTETSYSEYFIFTAIDKCGNEVEIHYWGEYYNNEQ